MSAPALPFAIPATDLELSDVVLGTGAYSTAFKGRLRSRNLDVCYKVWWTLFCGLTFLLCFLCAAIKIALLEL